MSKEDERDQQAYALSRYLEDRRAMMEADPLGDRLEPSELRSLYLQVRPPAFDEPSFVRATFDLTEEQEKKAQEIAERLVSLFPTSPREPSKSFIVGGDHGA